MFCRIFVPFLLLLALVAPAQAAVDLVTLPTRESTQLTIYNSEDITMVREHRLLTVKEGVNRIQFSRANTLIVPASTGRLIPTEREIRILDLSLGFVGVIDAEMSNLDRGFPQLEDLTLRGSNVTDASLENLKGMFQLRVLCLSETKVTDAGVAKLQQALPNCKITR